MGAVAWACDLPVDDGGRDSNRRLRIAPYTKRYEAAANAFNQRMRDARAAVDLLLPESAPDDALDHPALSVDKRQYVVLEGETVRGGVVIQKQPHWIQGETHTLWNVQAPLSEGVADKRFGHVGAFLIAELLRVNPMAYAVGMGSASNSYARLLKAFRFEFAVVPFFFQVCNGTRFLRNAKAIRTSRARTLLIDAAAFTGVGSLAFRLLQAAKVRRFAAPHAQVHQTNDFGNWADEIWERCKPDYAWCALRNQGTLNCLYTRDWKRLQTLRIISEGHPIGWAVVLVSDLQEHKYFGSIRLGTIVDCLATRDDAATVVQAAAATLRHLNADLIVSNQSHALWRRAFSQAGFLEGPSNYLLATSPQLTKLAGLPGAVARVNINRGDADGIVNL